jgi:hypothetical protein
VLELESSVPFSQERKKVSMIFYENFSQPRYIRRKGSRSWARSVSKAA